MIGSRSLRGGAREENVLVLDRALVGLCISLDLPEVRERRKRLDAILFGQALVVDLHKVHTKGVGVVVDLL